jgi:uncharacterized protein (TIGR02598 family)
MNRSIHVSLGFSLVEVTLALGVTAFCMITLFGMLPLGLQINQSSTSQIAAASLLSSVAADLRATSKTSLTSEQYNITFGATKVLFFDGNGRAVTATDSTLTPRYRLTITFPAAPVGTFSSTFVSMKITWPALVDPTTTTPAGFVETFAAFDRH